MNKLTVILLAILFAASSCTVTKDVPAAVVPNQIWWVSGFKTECESVEKVNCLAVHKNENISNPNWENLYSNIEGFEFEAGYLKKIEIKMEKLDPKNVPADASSVKYTLVKELKKEVDARTNIIGKWMLNRLNDKPISRSVQVPSMEIDLNQMRVSGSGGCNKYFGAIEKLTTNMIQFGEIASTKMACFNNDIERDYHKVFSTVKTYLVEGDNLTFYNATGNKILSYTKQEDKANKKEQATDRRIHDIWAAVRIDGNPINRMVTIPRLEINLTKNKIFGNDGCNEYSGAITEVSDTQLKFGRLAATRKLCQNMEVTNRFNEAMSNVASYQLKGLNLILLDNKGKEVLAFLKID